MIELAFPPRSIITRTSHCGQCGQRPKDCRCAEIQEEKKRVELKALLAEDYRRTHVESGNPW